MIRAQDDSYRLILRQGKLSNPQSLNLYIYVLNLPTSLTDPSGLDWWNPFSWTPQQQAQAFTVAVIVVAVVAVVATGGIASPLAAAAIGAALSSTAYTVSAGDKATLQGAVTTAALGAVLGGVGAALAGGSAAGAGLTALSRQAVINGAVSGGVNAGMYAGATYASTGSLSSITEAGLGGTFASGFVSGALGTKGILSGGGGSVIRWAGANIISGEAGYVAGQYAQGQAPTITGLYENAAISLPAGLASDALAPGSNMRGALYGSLVGGASYFVDALTPVGTWASQLPTY